MAAKIESQTHQNILLVTEAAQPVLVYWSLEETVGASV